MLERVRITSPEELFAHNLGAALTMEKTIVDMLKTLIDEAGAGKLKQDLRLHLEQTQAHVRNLEQAFEALGKEPEERPCPAIEGIEKEGQANLKMTEETLKDDVILAGCAETEHHEIAVYENLITHADAMGQEDLVALFRENLEQEQETLRKVMEAALTHAREHATA